MGIPIFIDEKFIKLLIIGGGDIAYKKSKKFLDGGSEVCIISIEIDERFYKYKNCNIKKKSYEKTELKKNKEFYNFLIAATDDKKLNSEIALEGSRLGYIFLDTSDGLNSAFNFMRYEERENYLIAAYTFGKSPSISKKILNYMNENMKDELDNLIEELGKIRKRVKEKIIDDELKKLILNKIIEFDISDIEKLSNMNDQEFLKYFSDQGEHLLWKN